MVIKINPARLALWRDAKTLQLGLGREAVTLENVKETEERLINLLFRGIATDSLPDVGASIGLPEHETNHLMQRLRPALLEQSPTTRTERADALHEEFVRQAFAEIIRASFETNLDGRSVLAARALKTVSMVRLNKTSLVLSFALAAAGIGSIICDDDSPIEPADTGTIGFDRSQVGKPKNAMLAEILSKSAAPCRVTTSADLAKLPVDSQLSLMASAHPLSMADFSSTESRLDAVSPALLAIELGVEQSRVSPVIVAGVTPCLDCRNMADSIRDESWAALASQLRFRKERLDDAQTSLLCAGFALEKTLRYLDARQPASFEGTAIDHRTGLVQLQTWQKQPHCGC